MFPQMKKHEHIHIHIHIYVCIMNLLIFCSYVYIPYVVEGVLK